jgi:nicotinate-nucleotide pyrophosphorylase (carboxylating)
VTTLATVPASKKVRGVFIARDSGVLCGLPAVSEIFRSVDRRIRLRAKAREGARFRPDSVVASFEGPARGILAGERLALNLLSHLSGVADLDARFRGRRR